MYKDIRENNLYQIWDSENLGMGVYTEVSDFSVNVSFLKLGSGHILVVFFSIHLCIFEIFNTF